MKYGLLFVVICAGVALGLVAGNMATDYYHALTPTVTPTETPTLTPTITPEPTITPTPTLINEYAAGLFADLPSSYLFIEHPAYEGLDDFGNITPDRKCQNLTIVRNDWATRLNITAVCHSSEGIPGDCPPDTRLIGFNSEGMIARYYDTSLPGWRYTNLNNMPWEGLGTGLVTVPTCIMPPTLWLGGNPPVWEVTGYDFTGNNHITELDPIVLSLRR